MTPLSRIPLFQLNPPVGLLPRLLGRWPVSVGLLVLLLGTPVAAAEFLDPERAFQVDARQTAPGQLEVVVRIAPGYYVYRAPLKITAQHATLGAMAVPPGKVKYDENFQKNVETYRDELRIQVPVLKAAPNYSVDVVSQGCADAGLCYPPMTSRFNLKASARAGGPGGR